MKITLLTLLTISSSVLSALTVVPSKINYQGLITDTDGSPIVSTTNTITAHLYGTESGGTALYSESFVNVNSDSNGIYSIEIGDVGLQSVLEGNNELWLELIINQQTLSPRQKINSVPYALVAKATESVVPGSDADAAISTNASNISALQTDVDLNEADADLAIAALQAVNASSARQIIVDFGFTDNVPYLPSTSIDLIMPNNSGYYSCAVGDTVLLTGQINPSENGIYEITSFSYVSTNFNNANLERSSNYDSAEELNEVDLVLIEKGELSGVTFMPGAIAQTFVLGSDATTWHRLGINPNQNIEFGGRVTADELVVNGIYGSVNFDGSHNYISGGLDVSGNLHVSGDYVNLDYVNGVTVPTPDQNNEATNKAYVDAAVATNASAITTEATTRTSEITALQADIDQNESDADAAIATEASTARAAEQANTDAITALQIDVDQNESDADAAIANLQAQIDADTEIILATHALTQNYAFSTSSYYNPQTLSYEYDNYITYSNPYNQADPNHIAIGDTILLTRQNYEHTNGLYQVVDTSYSSVYIERVESLNESLEFEDGHIVFISQGDKAGYGYFLDPVGNNFVLDGGYHDNRDINYTLFTIDLTRDTEFEGTVTASRLRVNTGGSSIDFNGYNNQIVTDFYDTTQFSGGGEIRFSGGNVQFQDGGYSSSVNISIPLYVNNTATFGSSVNVPTPNNSDEAANKGYVDLVGNNNATSISDEINRAQSAESLLANNIADEAIRAAAAEQTNAAAISEEATTARAAEQANATAITALQSKVTESPRQIVVNFLITEDSAISSAYITTYDWDNDITYTCEPGDKVLLTGQIDSSENGIYEITNILYSHSSSKNVSLVRSDNYNSTDEVNAGDVVLIESGIDNGTVYMLGSLSDNFELGVDALPWHRSRINTDHDIEFGGRITANELVVNNGNVELTSARSVNVPSPTSGNNATSKDYVDNLVSTNAGAISSETSARSTAISSLQANINQNESNAFAAIAALQVATDQNETDADAAIANLQQQIDENTSIMFAKYAVTESVNSFVTFDNSIYNYADYITTTLPTNNFDLGDTVLFTNLGSYKNGLYNVVYKSSDYLGLNRVENLNESSEFREGHIVFISEGNNAGAGFFLNPVGDDFVLDSTFAYEDSDISYSQFTVNLNQDINFNGLYNIFSGNLSVSGTYVNFVNVDKVMVPTPDQSNEATNKAYVDTVVATNASAITAEAATARAAEQTIADAITALQSDVDQNESDANAAIAAEATTARAAEQAITSTIAALQSDVDQNESDADTAIANMQNQLNLNPARGLIDFAFEVPIYLEPAPPISGAYYSSSDSIFYTFEVGDKILLTAQSDASENGVYEIISLEFSQGYLDRANLNRASDFDSEEELTLGVFVFVESPSVTGYVLDQRAANFVLDDQLYGAIGFSRFTVDTSEFVNFSQGINADNISGNSISAGGATIWGDMAVNNDFQAGGNTALMNTSIGGTLSVGSDTSLDNLTGNGVINFAGASSVVVPDPTISEEVANKNYVDDFVNTSIASDNAKGLVQLAVTESVSNISEYYLTYESGGSTLNPAQGDLVLLTGQTTASENGIYEVSSVNLSSSYSSSSSSGPTATDYYVSLTRASNFNSANDFLTGSFVFVEKGTHAGKGYVLGELASNFSLGTSPVNYIQFTVDASIVENNSESIIDNSVDINTATVNISNNTDSIITLQADVDQNEADAEAAIADNAQRLVLLETAAPIWGTNQTAIADNAQRLDLLETAAPIWGTNQTAIADNAQRLVLLETAAPIWGTNQTAIADNAQRLVLLETAAPIWGTNQTAIADLQTDVDQNEADADSTIAALQASDAARPSQVPVLLAHEGSNYPNLNNVYVGYWDYALGQSKVAEAGDRILMVGQPSASDNGIYEVETLNNSYASLVRADDYNSAEEINAGDFVFVQAGDYAGQGYVLGATSESFELGVDALNFSRFTIDTANPVDFEDRITARELGVNNGYGGTIYFDGSYNYIGGNLAVSGNYVNFDSVNEVVVPTPDHPNEATNKAYVDSVVVPSGGLVAWSSASAIPTGWSDAGLSSPMPNYIWIIKD